jgi:hypothetical protein
MIVHWGYRAINGVYFILNGVAMGDELRQSNAFTSNKMVAERRKSASNIIAFCFDRISAENESS